MSEKKERFESIEDKLTEQGFKIEARDFDRPWGGFFVIDEQQANLFIETYFNDVEMSDANLSGKLSPKILLVEPGKRLSW
jgi:hypothetical protein